MVVVQPQATPYYPQQQQQGLYQPTFQQPTQVLATPTPVPGGGGGPGYYGQQQPYQQPNQQQQPAATATATAIAQAQPFVPTTVGSGGIKVRWDSLPFILISEVAEKCVVHVC